MVTYIVFIHFFRKKNLREWRKNLVTGDVVCYKNGLGTYSKATITNIENTASTVVYVETKTSNAKGWQWIEKDLLFPVKD